MPKSLFPLPPTSSFGADGVLRTGQGGFPELSSPVLPHCRFSRNLKGMEVHFAPDVEKQLNDLAAQSGRGADEVLQDALAGYFEEVQQIRQMLDSRYDDLKSGRVKTIDGEGFFESLRLREDELLNKHSS
jgi:hypothetical protein